MAGHDDNHRSVTLIESQLMDSLNPAALPIAAVPAERSPRIWKFWGTLLWGPFRLRRDVRGTDCGGGLVRSAAGRAARSGCGNPRGRRRTDDFAFCDHGSTR